MNFTGFTADLENLIRVIKRLARKLDDDHPTLTLAYCVSLECFSHNNGFKTGGYSPVQWAFGADNEGHGFTTTMPSGIETFRMSVMMQEQAKDAISRAQVRALAGTYTCHHDRSHSTMEWVGAFHDRTNWCCLVIARKQAD